MRKQLRGGAVLIGLPFLVRLLCLLELRGLSLFQLPLLDARIYHEMARRIADGSFQRREPFWQPPLYPYFLALLYKIGSPSPDLARVVQALLGSLSCWLVFRLGNRILGRRPAWTAWGIMALYGPLILFDLQLLGVTLAVFLLLLSLDWMTAAAFSESSGWRWPAAGLALGLAGITVATILVALPAVLVWIVGRLRSGSAWRRAILLLAGVLLPIMVVLAGNLKVSGEPVPISYNGGINFWLGNNPDFQRTVGLRPGRGWIALNEEPRRAGVTGYAATSSWWLRRSWTWIGRHPGSWIALLARKTHAFLQGNEIPRNQELYPFRQHSLVLRPLLWIFGIAFPFGLLLPLGGAGIVTLLRRKHDDGEAAWSLRDRNAFLLLLTTGTLLSLTVIAFFVTDRYRVPVVPFLALAAGGGIPIWINQWRGQRRRLLPAAAVGAGLLLLGNLGLPAMPAQFNSDAYSDLGLFYQEQGETDSARGLYELALARDPDNLDAANNLGGLYVGQGRFEAAAALFRKVLTAYPDDSGANLNLGSIYFHKGDPYKAGDCYLRVYKRDPGAPHAEENLRGLERHLSGMEAEGMRSHPGGFLDSLEQMYRRDPENAFLRSRLVRLLETRGEKERVRRIEEIEVSGR